MQSKHVLTAEHLALHLPKIAAWARGYGQETTLETSRDAVDNPFGALVHTATAQHREPWCALVSRRPSFVASRRRSNHRTQWWRGSAAENPTHLCRQRCRAVGSLETHPGSTIRAFHERRSTSKAERTNWTVADGTRTTLIQAGSSAACLAMAMQSQNAIWSGFMMGNDWLAPHRRRHGEGASHECHPLGALTSAKLPRWVGIVVNELTGAEVDSLCGRRNQHSNSWSLSNEL